MSTDPSLNGRGPNINPVNGGVPNDAPFQEDTSTYGQVRGHLTMRERLVIPHPHRSVSDQSLAALKRRLSHDGGRLWQVRVYVVVEWV